jgi:predicted Zn-dependent protease
MKLLRILLALVFVTTIDFAEANLCIVRDAEVEETLTEMAKSIFKVAGLRPESAKIYVFKSATINAFTIGNGYIFLSSELLLRFKNPLHILGILCHETAHIAAGHINRHISVIQQRSRNFTLAMLAGILGAVVTGSEEAIALALGYAVTDERFYLKYSRGEELAADALAATYLEKLGYGADVLMEAFDVFQRMDILNGEANLPVYVRTHPKTSDRISALQKRTKLKKYTASTELSGKHNRILIKLRAYLKRQNSWMIAPDDDYSKAIYFHRMGKSQEATELLRKLLKTNPNDLYYRETLAQTLYEAGQLEESIRIYEKIYNKDINVLIKIDYANALIEANKNIALAVSILESAKYADYFNSDIYRLLAKGYGKQKKEGLSMLVLAQEQMLLRNYRSAHELLINSLEKLNPKTESALIKKAKYFKELLEREYKEYL